MPLVSAIFEAGRFNARDAHYTALTLSIIALGLPAYVLVKVLTPGFYARRDTATPVKTAIAVLVANVILNFALIPRFGIGGLAAAVALSSWLNCTILYVLLHRRGHFRIEKWLASRLARQLIAAAAMVAALIAIRTVLVGLVRRLVRPAAGGRRSAIVGGGMIVYFPLVWILGGTDRKSFKRLVRRQEAVHRCRLTPCAMRVVSGIQPTGDLHLGNLLGAILRWVRMQDEAECLFFLADLHALTVDVDPTELRASVREMAAALIASGIDPGQVDPLRAERGPRPCRARLDPPGCTARMGWLNRMTQWKDKAGKNRKARRVGLFTYPVLQAADILLYQATHVPVGEDQKQHVELTRDIALKFNTDFDVDLFVPPEPYIGGGDGRAGDEPARRQVENVQDRPVGHEPDQPDRQRRADRAEDPQGQDRPRAAARRSGRTRRPAGSEEPRRHLCARSPAKASSRCCSASPARDSAPSSRRWPTRWSRCSRRCAPASSSSAPIRPSSTGCSPAGAERAANSAAPTLAAAYDAVGLTR